MAWDGANKRVHRLPILGCDNSSQKTLKVTLAAPETLFCLQLAPMLKGRLLLTMDKNGQDYEKADVYIQGFKIVASDRTLEVAARSSTAPAKSSCRVSSTPTITNMRPSGGR
jgi:hypothetical protein